MFRAVISSIVAVIAAYASGTAPDLSQQGRHLEPFFRQLDLLKTGFSSGNQKILIVDLGDSHLAGTGDATLGRYLAGALGPWAAGHLDTRPLAKVGASICDLEQWLRHPGFQGYLAGLRPALVVFRFGTNDAALLSKGMSVDTFERRMRAVIAKARATFAGGASLAWIAPPDQDKYGRWMPVLIEAMRRVCAAESVFWLDLWVMMGGSGSFKNWQAEGRAATDGLHFTRKGYAQMQSAAAKVLAIYYRNRPGVD